MPRVTLPESQQKVVVVFNSNTPTGFTEEVTCDSLYWNSGECIVQLCCTVRYKDGNGVEKLKPYSPKPLTAHNRTFVSLEGQVLTDNEGNLLKEEDIQEDYMTEYDFYVQAAFNSEVPAATLIETVITDAYPHKFKQVS